MEIFVRLFAKLLHYVYGKMAKSADRRDPLVEDALQRAEDEIEDQRRQQIVDSFKSTASPPVHGAIDYEAMQWELFTRAVESPAQFTFYSERGVAKIVEKSSFAGPLELATFRRVVRRQIADCKLLAD